jgi:hypothetical protein
MNFLYMTHQSFFSEVIINAHRIELDVDSMKNIRFSLTNKRKSDLKKKQPSLSTDFSVAEFTRMGGRNVPE